VPVSISLPDVPKIVVMDAPSRPYAKIHFQLGL
jgi:hypothetical protein